MGTLSYHEEIDKENVLKLRELLEELPPYCKVFLRRKIPLLRTAAFP